MALDHVHEIWYGTAVEFAEYCANRGYTIPAGDPTDALVRGSTYIDARYGPSFIGYKTHGREQPRAWPRTNAYDAEGWYIGSEETPTEVRQATYEAALRELQDPGSLQPDITPGKIKESVQVGSVAVTYAVGAANAASQLPVLTILDGILAPLLGGGMSGGNALVGRMERSA